MSKIAVVTSCSAKGWAEYGERFVDTFLQHWPQDVALHLVSEDDIGEQIRRHPWPRPFTAWRLSGISPHAQAFHLRHCDDPKAHGLSPDQQVQRKKSNYNFRFDAYRFSKKVFSIAAIAKQIGRGRLFWIDADVETFAPVPAEMFTRLLPADAVLSCLDRGSYHSECGFVGYNLDRYECHEFIGAFVELYESDRVFELAEWHDSWVFDWLRRQMPVPTFRIPHNSRHHPFVNSELGTVMDHRKGKRKAMGRTPSTEVLNAKTRALPYWSGAQ